MITFNNPSVGDTIKVRISSINPDIGAFATMPNGRDGLIRLYDIAWSNQKKILSTLHVGEVLEVKVIKQLPDGKLNLSRKEMMPNPRLLEKGTIYTLPIKSIESFGILVHLGDYTALIPKKEYNDACYSVGDKITCVVIDNTYDEEKHRNNIVMSVLELHAHFAKVHPLCEHIKCAFKKRVQIDNSISAIVVADEIYEFIVPFKRFIEPYKSKLLNDEIESGEEIEFVYEKFNDKLRGVVLDMRPIEKEQEKGEKLFHFLALPNENTSCKATSLLHFRVTIQRLVYPAHK